MAADRLSLSLASPKKERGGGVKDKRRGNKRKSERGKKEESFSVLIILRDNPELR